jgi:hypothetical protein
MAVGPINDQADPDALDNTLDDAFPASDPPS